MKYIKEIFVINHVQCHVELAGKLNESIEFLEGIAGIKVFTHDHIPEQWHYSNNQRIDKVCFIFGVFKFSNLGSPSRRHWH